METVNGKQSYCLAAFVDDNGGGSAPSLLLWVPRIFLLLGVLDHDVSEQSEQGLLAPLVPGLHEATVTLAGWRLVPPEVAHLVGPVLLLLNGGLRVLTGQVALLQGIVQVMGQVTPFLLWVGPSGLLLRHSSVHLDWPTLAPHGFAPAEVLHGIGALILMREPYSPVPSK